MALFSFALPAFARHRRYSGVHRDNTAPGAGSPGQQEESGGKKTAGLESSQHHSQSAGAGGKNPPSPAWSRHWGTGTVSCSDVFRAATAVPSLKVCWGGEGEDAASDTFFGGG